jgi:hypothetical protein
MQGALKLHVAFPPVVVDHAQSAVAALIAGKELLADLGDIDLLAADDEKLALLALCSIGQRRGRTRAARGAGDGLRPDAFKTSRRRGPIANL